LKISFKYNDLDIEITTRTINATADAIQVASDILDRFRELGHGNPKMEINLQKEVKQ
jgi:hypothetical protein